MAYVFWAPYERRAGGFEWAATALTLAAVLALFLAALTYAEQRRLVAGFCGALVLIAVGSLAYRPSGGMYFCVAAAFVPSAVGGRVRWSMAIVSAVAVLFGVEWCLLYLDGSQGAFFPLLVAAQIFVSGSGGIVAVRQTRELQRLDKASERERIAKDLHDVLGHSLASLALKAELARRVFHTDPQRALFEIGDIERIARHGLEETRGAIHGYYSGDIHAELDRVESLLKAADINVERRCEDLEMSPANERVLALIVREAVTNILRHSHARACRLALFRAEGAYRLEISDDGGGGSHEEGVGMRSIRTRAEALGGTAGLELRDGDAAVRESADLRHGAWMSTRRIRVVIAEDQRVVLGALAAPLSLEDDIEVVAQASDGTAALAMVREHQPDVLITDVEMPGMSGLDVAQVLKGDGHTRVVVLTNFARAGYLRRALEAGVNGYVLKAQPADELADAVRRVQRGLRVIDPQLAAESWSGEVDPLTARQREILLLATEGASTADIGGAAGHVCGDGSQLSF